ncbi:MAG: MotA/TolQ/ExbB proton channel family protein [Deltaproteobacteria bacterium]|nr:MotA/TolQ/ExbB proton channel family protein [Deltaproteobacteria bacterium]MBW1960207.1 MotA/TolQ/ExbB proton channel family protein [Deltaproteobacteria bacterium]MBW2150610.1 MotA/TolQ/ExbB proton channel family protein [Deltaproteobacteria bacterium]
MGPQDIDIIHMIRNASLMVQFVLFLLFIFSVTSWAIILIKFRYIRRAFKESAFFTEFFWKTRDLSAAFTKAKQLNGSPVARIFRIGYVELKKISQYGYSISSQSSAHGSEDTAYANAHFIGTENVKRALRRAINTETTRMTQMVPFLATTGNTTPFIGLFGTVWGIMGSFHGIGLRGSANLAVVAPGISEALIATAAGLAVAIPAVIAFNYFSQKIRIIESDLHSFSADFLNIIERDLLRAEGGRE